MLDEINKYIEKSEPDACNMGHLMLSLELPCHWIKYLKWLFNKALMWSERSLPVIAVVFDQDIMTQLLVFAILICSCWGFPVGKIWISFDTDHYIFYLIFWFFLLLSLSLPNKFPTIKVMRTWFSTFYMFPCLDEATYRADISHLQDEVNLLKANLSAVWEKLHEHDELLHVTTAAPHTGPIRTVYRNTRRFRVKLNFFMDIPDHPGDDGSVVVQGI